MTGSPSPPAPSAPPSHGEPGAAARLRLACLLGVTGFGGAQNSCLALANALAARGHDVALFHDADRTQFVFGFENARRVHLPSSPILPEARRIIRGVNLLRLARHLRRGRFDALIVFTPRALTLAQGARVLTGIPTVHYALGITGPIYLRGFAGTIVANSLETRTWLAEVMDRPADRIPVVRARIPVAALERRAAEPCPACDALPRDVKRFVLVSRLHSPTHVGMATSAIRAADLVARKRGDFCLALAGDGSQRAAIEALADEVNRRHGRTVVHVLGHVDNVAALFRQADAVLGIGRGLWEGMAFGKPALVVGRMGLAGVVRPETVEELGYYNFAGRNATEPVPPERLAEELERILADDAYARGLGDFARRFILETFDAAVGAAQMERVVAAEVARGRLTCRQRLACLPGLAAMLLKEARTTAGGLVRKLTGRRAAPRDETP